MTPPCAGTAGAQERDKLTGVQVARRTFLSSMAASVLAQQAGRPRPNFIIIYTDDQGIGDAGCYGAKDVRTPNIDRLAAEGARFTDWYSNSPVCSPSRASLLTGKYPERTGIIDVLESRATFDVPGLRRGESSLPGELRKLGYRTALVGKWHLGSASHSRPMSQGFDEFFGFYSGWIDGLSHRYYKLGTAKSQIFHDLWYNDAEIWREPEYHTDLFSRTAAEWVAKRGSKPFLLYLAFGAPHYPMIAPQRCLDRFPETMDRDRRMHAAMLAAVDDGVGRLLEQLRRSGINRNTVVFFQSDNGATQEERADHLARPYGGGSNAPFRGYKMGLFEGGIRMPALMRWPGVIAPGTVVNEPGMAMDIAPTFLKWAGGAMPAGIDGGDVSEMISSGARSPHEAIFWMYKDQRAVRRGKWKLIENPPSFAGEPVSDKLWLSNLADDPGEKRNWASESPDVVKELSAMLSARKAQS